jgi:hypothetical protein
MPLPDDAHCRILTPHPATDPAELLAGLDKLFAQFVREDRLQAWACTAEHAGAALVLAWSPGRPLSGCSHDRINRLLVHHEERTGSLLLAPPPICIQVDGAWRCVDRQGLRAVADASTPLLDSRLERLGDWRARGLSTVGASWAAALIT